MQTTLTGIRNIIMRRGTSVSRTVSLTFQSKADISSASFTDAQVYSKQPEKRKEAIVDATNYAAKAGLDAAGAESVEFPLVLFGTFPWCLPSDQLCLAEASTLAGEALIPLSA